MLCTSLQSVDIPSSITTIGDFCFQKTGLSSLTIPSSVTSLGQYIVALCDNLKSVYVSYTEPFEITNKTFMTYDNRTWKETGNIDATLYVPQYTKTKYEATSGWNEFPRIVETAATNIKTVRKSGNNMNIYTINGHSFEGRQTRPGIYIINGRKIVVK